MTSEELKSKILNQFGDQLNEIGADIEIVQVDKLPSDKDLTKDKSIITYLGKVGEKFIWLSKNVLGAIIIYVTIMSMPQAIENHKLHFPKSYELVVEIGKSWVMGHFLIFHLRKNLRECWSSRLNGLLTNISMNKTGKFSMTTI